jgi:hypothetical protein
MCQCYAKGFFHKLLVSLENNLSLKDYSCMPSPTSAIVRLSMDAPLLSGNDHIDRTSLEGYSNETSYYVSYLSFALCPLLSEKGSPPSLPRAERFGDTLNSSCNYNKHQGLCGETPNGNIFSA